MELNSEIHELLKAHNINLNVGIPYLLAVYYGYGESPLFDDKLKRKIQTVGIYELKYIDKVYRVSWEIPLFRGNNPMSEGYDWVHKYISMFEQHSDHIGDFKTCQIRFQNFLLAHPDVNINEIRKATAMYLRETDRRYIRKPHFFIKKGVGKDAIEDLYEWVLKVRKLEDISSSEGKTSLSNTMQ